MRHFLKWTPLVGLLSTLAAPGCSSQSGPTDAFGSAQSSVVEPVSESSRLDWIEATLGELPLTPPQKTAVAALLDAARDRQSAATAARATLRNVVAAEVRAGTLDVDALAPEIAGVTSALTAERAGALDGLVKLHDLLDTTERNQFANAMETRSHGAHAGRHRGHRLREWAAALGLTDVQQTAIKAAFRSDHDDADAGTHRGFDALRDKKHQVLEAFRDAELTVAELESLLGKDTAGPRLTRRLELLQKTVRLLTAGQRALAADRILATNGNL